jgi:glycine oxidase
VRPATKPEVVVRQSAGQRSYDAVVIGAGIVGLACAWRAAERGLSVLCVDREGAGAGASTVAAGMLAPVTEADFGEEALLRLSLEAAAGWPEFAGELEDRAGASVAYRASGSLEAAADRDDLEELRRRLGLRRSLGLEVEWLTGRECRRLEPGLSPRVSGGIVAAGDGHVDPRAVVGALLIALERAGGELLTGVRAAPAVTDGRVVGVDLEGDGFVAAERVVAAAGAHTRSLGGLGGGELPPVRPVKGQILRLRTPPGGPMLATRVVRTPRCYVVSRDGGEVVVGATVEERGEDRTVTAGGIFSLLEAAREVLPDVDELEWVEARAGLRPGTPDNGPIVGAGGPEGLVWATGHYRSGVLLAPLTGEAVANALVGAPAPPALGPFSPARFADREGPTGVGARAVTDGGNARPLAGSSA